MTKGLEQACMNRLQSSMTDLKFNLVPRLIVHEHNGYFGIYNCFYNTWVVLNKCGKDVLDIFKKTKGFSTVINAIQTRYKDTARRIEACRLIFDLLEKHIVIDSRMDDPFLVKVTRDYVSSLKPNVSMLYIVPSLRCNFSCDYCYRPKSLRDLGHPVLTFEHIKKAIRLFSYNYTSRTEHPLFKFIGGEPLLHMDIIKKTINYICNLGSKSHFGSQTPCFSISTNGALLTPAIVDLIEAYDISLGVSMDGRKLIHDKCRLSKNRVGTFDLVMKGVDLLRSRNIPFAVNLTLGRHNINSVGEDIRWISRHVSDTFNFNIMKDFLMGSNRNRLPRRGFNERLKNLYNTCIELNISESEYMRRWNRFENNRARYFHCDAMGLAIKVTPYGTIGPCDHLIGVNDAKYFDAMPKTRTDVYIMRAWKPFLNRSPVFDRTCSARCKYFTFCGGGCSAESVAHHGDVDDIDRTICNLTKFYLKYFLERKCIERELDEKTC